MSNSERDPWAEGQKDINAPGWLAFLLLAPFRLLFGVLMTARATSIAFSGTPETERQMFDDEYYEDVAGYGHDEAQSRALHNITDK